MAEQRHDLGSIMSAPVETVSPSATLADAADSMTDHQFGALVIGENGRVDGIVTERDLLRASAAGASLQDAVADWMTSDPVTAKADTSFTAALEQMQDGGFRHLPVVDGDGALAGIVSLRDLIAVAHLEPVSHPGDLEAPKGLAGVIVSETEIGDVRGQEGFYHYREYSATDLAEQCTIEDVWHLMLRGELPDDEQRAAFVEEVTPLREVPKRTAELLPAVAATADQPLDGLRTAVSLVGAELGFEPSIDLTAEVLADQALRITAVVPTLIMALYRLGRGDERVAPDPELPYAANYLKMMTGDTPDPEHARAVEQYLISTIDHGFNASTFTARVITSTGADLAAAVVGAIGALSGPLHGGAPSRALDLLDEIQDPDRADEVVRHKVENGERIMGFGHRVYKTQDPRSKMLGQVAQRLGGDRAELAAQVEQTVVDVLADLKPGRELYANVEYYAGVVFEQIGLPPALFTPTFTASRTIGWCAHILEQAADNRLIRPTARYVGPPPPQPIPDHARR
ncbi:MAG: citrate synthase [Nitriliruptorales bacterium]|nr:citrate synthase [Nitriliruptorales bacterium]